MTLYAILRTLHLFEEPYILDPRKKKEPCIQSEMSTSCSYKMYVLEENRYTAIYDLVF